jgi:hypothetical protein
MPCGHWGRYRLTMLIQAVWLLLPEAGIRRPWLN